MNKINTVTQEQIDRIIDETKFEVFHRVHKKQCMVVALLPNGFTIVGESACVNPDNYKEDVGFSLAVERIVSKIWELEGYLLQDMLANKEVKQLGEEIRTVGRAYEVLGKAILEDKEVVGGYYHSWQSNIACKIMDNSDIDIYEANELAKKILELFE